jgi:hypothetical protein
MYVTVSIALLCCSASRLAYLCCSASSFLFDAVPPDYFIAFFRPISCRKLCCTSAIIVFYQYVGGEAQSSSTAKSKDASQSPVHESSRQVQSDESQSKPDAKQPADVKAKTEPKEMASEVKGVKQEVAEKSAGKEASKKSTTPQPQVLYSGIDLTDWSRASNCKFFVCSNLKCMPHSVCQ